MKKKDKFQETQKAKSATRQITQIAYEIVLLWKPV